MYEQDCIEYVDGRLRGTVVRLKDNFPYEVLSVVRGEDKKYVTEGRRIKSTNYDTVPLSDLILESPQLGYTNYDGNAFYIGRWPKRRDWRQGLRKDNMFTLVFGRNLRHYMFDDYVPLIVPCLRKYPSYEECLERVEDIYDSCAFSPYFAINRKKQIIYKNQKMVGKHAVHGKRPELDEDNLHLSELLHDELNIHN